MILLRGQIVSQTTNLHKRIDELHTACAWLFDPLVKPISPWLLGHCSTKQLVYTTCPPPVERSDKKYGWDGDTTRANFLTSNSPSSNYSHFTFKVSLGNNNGVKPLVWSVWARLKHSESHCGSVEQSVLWAALQMDRYTIVLLFKERRMKEYSNLKKKKNMNMQYVKDF